KIGNLLSMLGRNANDTGSVRHDDVAWADAHASALDRLVDSGDANARAAGQRRHVPGEDRQTVLLHLLAVTDTAIDDEPRDALDLGGERRQPAPGRDGVPAVVDNENIALAGGIDHMTDLEIVRREAAARTGRLR